MFVLKDRYCSVCGGAIAVLPYTETDKFGRRKVVVDCGRCTYCDKLDILPTEDYKEFIGEFCVRK